MINDKMGISGRVTIRSYSVENVDPVFADQDAETDREKLEAIREQCEPDNETVTSNVTCVGMHEYFVDELDPSQSEDESASHLALGDDSSSGTSSSDTSLNNEVDRKSVTDTSDEGTTLTTSTFFDSNELNGFTINEIGLFTSSSGGILLNHSTFPSITKDDSSTLTIDIDLTFTSA